MKSDTAPSLVKDLRTGNGTSTAERKMPPAPGCWQKRSESGRTHVRALVPRLVCAGMRAKEKLARRVGLAMQKKELVPLAKELYMKIAHQIVLSTYAQLSHRPTMTEESISCYKGKRRWNPRTRMHTHTHSKTHDQPGTLGFLLPEERLFSPRDSLGSSWVNAEVKASPGR